MRGYLRSLDPQLPRDVWLLQIGGVANAFGNGIVFPFLAIYLHNVRGFRLATAGIAIANSAAALLTAGVRAGSLVDRIGARPRARLRPRRAGVRLRAAPARRTSRGRRTSSLAIEGIGSGAFWPSQSTLHHAPHAARARCMRRSRMQRLTMNLGVGARRARRRPHRDVDNPTSFTVLFVLDGLTFLALRRRARVHPRPRHEAAPREASRRVVPRGAPRPLFIGLSTLNSSSSPRATRSSSCCRRSSEEQRRPERAPDRHPLLLQHARDRRRAAAALEADRGTPPHARARAHGRALGGRVARDRRDRLLVRGDRRVRPR